MSESRSPVNSARGKYEFTQRVLIVAAVALVTLAAATAFALAYDVFFLFFLAVLLAILLRAAGNALARTTGIGPGWSLGIVIAFLLALAGGGAYGLGTVVVGQVNQFSSDLPKSLDQARNYLQQYAWGREALQQAPSAERLVVGRPGDAAARVTSFFSTTFGVIGNLLVLTFLTLYLAASPRVYREGVIRLVPPAHRDRAEQVVSALGYHLRWWMVGRAVAMAVVALITGMGLWIVGVEQFLILGVLAGLLNAIPYLGPIISAVPGVLLALIVGPTTALWAAGVYLLAQAVDNYLVTPLIQQSTVNLPPALTIIALVLVGVLFGVLGLIVAAPLLVTVMVMVKMLYVEDTLGDRLHVPGAEPLKSTHVPHGSVALGGA